MSEIPGVTPEMTEEEVVAHVKRCRRDLEYFAPRFLKVQTTGGDLVPFTLNRPQRLLLHIFKEVRKKRLLRVVILKGRRMGVSTLISAWFYQRTALFANRYAMQVTHEPQASEFIFKMVKRYYDLCPAAFRPEVRANNARLMEFNNKEGSGLNSAFRVATAGKDDLGSGQLIHFLHGCLAPDTPVLVEHGREKLAQDIVLGDKVVTHTGAAAKVTYITRKQADSTVVVHPWMGYPLRMTAEHKVWTNMGWVEAGNLDPAWHLLAMPIRTIRHGVKSLPVHGQLSKYGPRYTGPDTFDLTEETGFFVGYYLAEGHLSRAASGGPCSHLVFALRQGEDRYAERACAAVAAFSRKPPRIKDRPGTLTRMYSIDSTALATFVNTAFGRVQEKHVPDWVFDCGEGFCRGLVAGYLSGDGSKTLGGQHQGYVSNTVSATSIRSSLVYQVRDLVAALGMGWGTVSFRPGGVVGKKRERNQSPAWTVGFNGACGYALRRLMGIESGALGARYKRGERYRLDNQNGMVWFRIKSIEPASSGEVIDFEVDHADHSFRTAHFSVSNSELSKWPAENTDTLLTSVLQTIPKKSNTAIIFESTAKGIGGEFHDRFWSARYRVWAVRLSRTGNPILEESINPAAAELNDYTSIFLPWFVFEENRMTPPEGFVRTREEVDLAKQFGLDDELLYWRRYTIANECRGSLEVFQQEHPGTPSEAFLGTGRPVFDNRVVEKARLHAPPPIARYEILGGNFLAAKEGRFKVWQEPKPGAAYILSADVAEGLAKGDAHAGVVIDHRTGEQAAEWHGRCDPDQYAQFLLEIGKRYNSALIAPERNNHGLIVVTHLFSSRYPNLYCEMVPDPPGRPRKRYGWMTSSATRPLIIDRLIQAVRDGTHGIKSAEALGEMLSFKIQDDGRFEADAGRHDDLVIAHAIAQHLRQVTPLPAMRKQGRDDLGTKTKAKPTNWA